MQLTNSQKNTVQKLLTAFKNKNQYKFASFKAPTGAGKTFMASEFISQIFASQLGHKKKTIFVVATVSNAELPKQFANKLNNYRKYHQFQNYQIEYIQSPSKSTKKIEDINEFVLNDNKVFVFGVSSFGQNSLFHQNKTLDTFLSQAKEFDYQIFFIRDEAHIGKKESINSGLLKSFDEKLNSAADFIIHMTATPKDHKNLIIMTPEDMEQDGVYLLKTKMEKYENPSDSVSNEELIDQAINKFKKIKLEYQKLPNEVINPAMLIQVMNESDYEKDPVKNEQFKEGLKLLEDKLKHEGLKYLKYLNNSPVVVNTNVPNTLEYASKIDSEIDVIIFKVGPATGWDIPRANMLLQLRNVSSESLNVQTLGRIMRNPYPNLQKNSVTDKYYLWSNYQKPTREQAYYQLKSKFLDEKFLAGKIDKNSKMVANDSITYNKDVLDYIESKEFNDLLDDLNIEEDIVYDFLDYGGTIVKNKIPNHIYLKIENIKKINDLNQKFEVKNFEDKLKKIAKIKKINLEIVWYVFLKNKSKLFELKNKNSKWIHHTTAYELIENVQTQKSYTIWKDNNLQKGISTKDFENYGFFQVTDIEKDTHLQYLDSTPELQFCKGFMKYAQKYKNDIKFFAKMPTLGSKVYFEYYSKSQADFSKSYMDFAIKFKDKIFMIEAKSRDNDYDPIKTEELISAYQIYMKKAEPYKMYLFLYYYNSSNERNTIEGMVNDKWYDDMNFKEFVEIFFK